MNFRLSDFQVNEIALDGTIVRLTSRCIPKTEDEDDIINGMYYTTINVTAFFLDY